MKKSLILIGFALCSLCMTAQEAVVTVKLFHTTDVHGHFFPFDFIGNKESKGSLARVSTYMKEQRSAYGSDHILLLDGGDLLQGQPSVYYYNFVDTESPHLAADVLNYIGYDAAVLGNHDIETGRPVFERWRSHANFDVLGSNIFEKEAPNDTPYGPYRIYRKGGVTVAVIGMITQAIPAWLPENLWKGLSFVDIEEQAARLIPHIKEKHRPDIIVGLFHSGVKTHEVAGFKESVGMEVAQRVPGFDVVLCGHDHTPFCEKVVNNAGDSVLIINPGAHAMQISNVTFQVEQSDKKKKTISVTGALDDLSSIAPDEQYMNHFAEAYQKTRDYVDAQIGEFTETIYAHDGFFGPSAFIDLLHSLQLKLTDADISLVAPLSMNAVIRSGKVYMRDMFNLYKYENLLYTMSLTGREIKGALEYAYGLWCNQMKSEEDHLLLIKPSERDGRYHFENPFFAFDSAAGIIYTVDVTKPAGERVVIASLANGQPFNENQTYKVAVNSYQGSGGAGILTDGAGISREELTKRILFSTDKDLRYYLGEEIKKEGTVAPKPLNQWRFIPEEWVKKAAKQDYELLFGPKETMNEVQ